ncbi:UNVERIFIED_CONTAM: hypothetical protein N8J90_00565 [Halobacillus marinus]
MLRDLKGIFYYLLIDYRFSFLVFWSILTATLVGFTLLSILVPDSSMIVFTSPIVFVFCIISGLNMTKETFPFCVKMGTTRTRYLLGTFAFSLFFSLVLSMVHLGIVRGFRAVLDAEKISSIRHYSLMDMLDVQAAWYNEIWVLGLLFFLFISIGFLLGSVFYRYGLIGGFSGVAVFGVLMMLPVTKDYLFSEVFRLQGMTLHVDFLLLLAAALLTFVPSWMVLRKASTTAARAR